MPSNHLILHRPFSSCLPSFPASGSFPMSQFFASGGQSIGVSASASALSNEYSGLISFKMEWLDLLAVQGTLKSLLQHSSSKASILWHLEYIKGPKIQILLSHILSLVLQDLSSYRAKVTAPVLQFFFLKAQSKLCFIVSCSVTRKKKKGFAGPETWI